MAGIGTLSVIAFDCPDPLALAEFWSAVLGQKIVRTDPDWVELRDEDGQVSLAFQLVDDDYRPPQWPGQVVPQQAHLDIEVIDLDEGEARVVPLGARRVAESADPDDRFRVYLDPAGHPFCLVEA